MPQNPGSSFVPSPAARRTADFVARKNTTFNRLISSLSVRVRIALIALIPVVGFLANGIAFKSGEAEVEAAFDSLVRMSALTDASRDYQRALANMRIAARDFASRPTEQQVKAFEEAKALALSRLYAIERTLDAAQRDDVDSLRTRLNGVAANFDMLVFEQKQLGFSQTEGLQSRIYETGNAVERIISEELAWMAENDAKKLLVPLLIMRRAEAEARVSRTQLAEQAFFSEYKKFGDTLDRIGGSATLKDPLAEKVKAYADAFAEWIQSIDKVQPFFTLIDLDTQQMMPTAEKLIVAAGQRAAGATEALKESQARTRAIIAYVGIIAVLLGLAFSWLIGRSITRPLNGLAAVMKRLAAGDTSARIPATQARDEIGAMARTVIVFRDTMIERERLAASQAETSRARELRSEMVGSKITLFKHSIQQALSKLRAAAAQLEATSSNLNGAADEMSSEARNAEDRVNAASGNVTAAASSVEELAASIGEIASQANKSTAVASRAVAEARRTSETMGELGRTATRIGEVISLIQAIAGQTNLLALNATIEAARAGDAGRGFAVVASEVKSLAGQTARATEDIAAQIGAIQSATVDAAQALTQVNTIIEDMSMIASNVAATVEEQNNAVAAIAQGVTNASAEARTGAEAMSRVAGATTDARATAADVKALADTLAVEAESLEAEVRHFLDEVQAA